MYLLAAAKPSTPSVHCFARSARSLLSLIGRQITFSPVYKTCVNERKNTAQTTCCRRHA
jgi:hypothetical protein